MTVARTMAGLLKRTSFEMAKRSSKYPSLIFLHQPKVDLNLKQKIKEMSEQAE